jgi:hypothetical protein
MLFGLDYLGGAKFSTTILKNHPNGWAAGFFAETFGDSYPVIEKLLKKGICPHVRVQLLWDDNHKYGDHQIPAIKKLAAKFNKLAVQFPWVKIELSPFCEHNISKPDPYLDIAQKAAPNCTIVNTVWKGGLSKKYKNETHGKAKAIKGPANFSWDGTNCFDSDAELFKIVHDKVEVFYFWFWQMNGKMNEKDTTPRPNRKSWPTRDLIRSAIALAGAKYDPNLSSAHIWKSHSEQTQQPAGKRELKPVLITKRKALRAELVLDNGDVLIKSDPPLPYEESRFRYYIKEWGFKLAKQAIAKQGHPIVRVRVGKEIIGKVNPAFRAGTYRL